jgi:UMF1 family MFS transporter
LATASATPRALAGDAMDGRIVDPAPTAPPSRRAANAWAFAQASRDPYVILISIYIFAPYFVTQVVGDPVAGQTIVAGANKWGGWFVMLAAPLCGAAIDRIGPRKPLLASITIAMALCVGALWFARPGGEGLPIWASAAIIGTLAALIAFHELLHNALLLPAAGMKGAARASGLALAGGNALSVLMLVGVLVAFALPGKVDWPWLPASPLFGLDPALGEPDRIVAPIVAVVLALGVIPLLRLVPDMARSRLGIGAALRAGAGDLKHLVVEARGHRNALLFLVARMIYTDGLTAILVFGGLFAAGVMHWQTLEMIGYGIVLSLAAVVGGLLAGFLDDRIGPTNTVRLQLCLTIVAETLILGMGADRILYQPWQGAPLWDGPLFTKLPEIVFLGLGCLLAVGVSGAYASSRTLLTRVAPADKLGVFFGLYVLSGSATMWLGPLLVESATHWGGSQAWGMVPVIGMLLVGLIVLMFVRGGNRLGPD